jgi:hypothetical protein
MNSIGGYFELELKEGVEYHKNALKLNTARNCLEYILRVRDYHKVYIPYYACDAIITPFQKQSILYEFYSIDSALNPIQTYSLKENEAFLYINYFGIKQGKILDLVNNYGRRLIVDNSQAFFSFPLPFIDTFYSARKFFGVADGGYLYIDTLLDVNLEQEISYERMDHLLKRIDINAENGYHDFVRNEDYLRICPIRKMSFLTNKILSSIDYEHVKQKRIENFYYLHNELKDSNILEIDLFSENDVPMVYPYLSNKKEISKDQLIQHKIFVATYWTDIFSRCELNSIETFLAKNLLSLPIDQRISQKDLDRILKILKYGF